MTNIRIDVILFHFMYNVHWKHTSEKQNNLFFIDWFFY